MAEFDVPARVRFQVSEAPLQEEIDAAVAAHLESIRPVLAELAISTTQAFINGRLSKMVEQELEQIVRHAVHDAVSMSRMRAAARGCAQKRQRGDGKST